MTLRRFVMAALVVLAGAAQGGPADAAEHAALVIGNAAYQSVTPLANPVNDADDMANALRGLGYATTLVTDGSLDAMNEGLRQFLRDADGASAATIFYAGHGVQVNGKNFLIPVDAVVRDELDLDTKAVSLDKLLDLVDRSGVKVKIVILDACRDNPLARSLVRGAGTRGLARVELPASSAK
ncbi:MAG: caspase family protein, partial [Hyphomicrobiales bacterium]